MKFIYAVRFEDIDLFTKPRLAVEFAQKFFPEFTVDIPLDFEENTPISEISTEKLISLLNKEPLLELREGKDRVRLVKKELLTS